MRKFPTQTAIAALLVAGIGIASASATTPVSGIDKGFNPDTGQINPGVSLQSPSASPPGINDQSGEGTTVTNRAQPVDTTTAAGLPYTSHAAAERAERAPEQPNPLPGQQAAPKADTVPSGKAPDQMDHAPAGEQGSGGTQAIGGSNAPGAANPAKGVEQGNNSVGNQMSPAEAQLAAQPGPIGSTGQTLPAKFSEQNSALDKVPIMAAPFALTDAQKQSLVAAANGETVSFDGKPAAHVPDELVLGGAMTEIPAELVRTAPGLGSYKLLKTKDRVLIVNPRLRTVIGEVMS